MFYTVKTVAGDSSRPKDNPLVSHNVLYYVFFYFRPTNVQLAVTNKLIGILFVDLNFWAIYYCYGYTFLTVPFEMWGVY